MSDMMKIVCAAGLGLFCAAGKHLYLVIGTRVRNIGPTLGLLIYLAAVIFLIGGSLGGLAAINGLFDHDRQISTPHGKNMFIVTFLCWFGAFIVYSMLNRRNAQRLKQLIKDTQ
jgi:hypothetical protein